MKERAHIVIHGRVQGVCFRAFTCEEAGRLGITGWVRNMPNGTVEAVAEGETSAVDDFVAACRRGPPAALVRSVETELSAATGEFDDFVLAFSA